MINKMFKRVVLPARTGPLFLNLLTIYCKSILTDVVFAFPKALIILSLDTIFPLFPMSNRSILNSFIVKSIFLLL